MLTSTRIRPFDLPARYDLPKECIYRKLPVAVCHSLPKVPRDGVDEIGGKRELPAQSLESMSPRMTWREPLVRQTEARSKMTERIRGGASIRQETPVSLKQHLTYISESRTNS